MSVTALNDFICYDTLQNHKVNGKILGFQFAIRLSFYRTLSLSCIEDLKVKADGNEIESDAIVFIINNKRFSIAELPDLFGEWWYVMDTATLFIDKFGGLSKGNHEIEVAITLRGPYMNYHGDKYLTFTEVNKKTLVIN